MKIGLIATGIRGSVHYEMAQELTRQGHDLVIYTEDDRAPSGMSFTRLDEGGLHFWMIHGTRRNPLTWLPDRLLKYWLGRRFFTTLVAIWRFIRANRDRNLFVVESDWLGVFVAIVGLFERFRWTVGMHDTDYLDAPIHYPGRPQVAWRTAAQRWVLRRTDLVRANSYVTRDALVAGGCAAEKIVTIPLHLLPQRMLRTLEMPLVQHRAACHADVCKTLGLPESTKLLMTMCRLTPVKHLELAVEALAALSRRDVVLVICGGDRQIPGLGSYAASLKALAQGLDVADRVLIPGEVASARVKDWLAGADIHLAPSWVDTFNYGVIEAALVGTFSITSSAVGATFWVERHGEACALASRNAEEWAQAIAVHLDQPPDLTVMQSCRAMLANELAPATIARQLEDAWLKIV